MENSLITQLQKEFTRHNQQHLISIIYNLIDKEAYTQAAITGLVNIIASDTQDEEYKSRILSLVDAIYADLHQKTLKDAAYYADKGVERNVDSGNSID